VAYDKDSRLTIELNWDQALVFYEYLSKKADLEAGEFAEEFEDRAEDLVASFVYEALEGQLDERGLVGDDLIARIQAARDGVRAADGV
jgi:hypothetical protein